MIKIKDKFCISEKNVTIGFELFQIGDDLLIVVTGGDKPHIGSITLGSSLENKTESLGNHMEHIITAEMFQRIKPYWNGTILISGGIHVDNISESEIEMIRENCLVGADKVISLISKYKETCRDY